MYKKCILIPGNYSVAGFELTLRRKVSHYIITYYLPSGMFVIVSWISFLVPPEIVPGRMTLLVIISTFKVYVIRVQKKYSSL